MSVLSAPRFHDEAAAFAYLEAMVWADGVRCPHCGVVGGRIYKLDGVRGKPSKKNPEGAIRYPLFTMLATKACTDATNERSIA